MVKARLYLKILAPSGCLCYGYDVSRSLVFRKGALRASFLVLVILGVFQSHAQAQTIQTEPSDLIVYEGQEALFTVVATGGGPISYQWKRDGADLPIEHSA